MKALGMSEVEGKRCLSPLCALYWTCGCYDRGQAQGPNLCNQTLVGHLTGLSRVPVKRFALHSNLKGRE